jgi:hypothetical protein
MALKLGAYTACLHDRPLEEALDVLGSNGLTSVEVNTGGFIPSPHCHVDLLLSSALDRDRRAGPRQRRPRRHRDAPAQPGLLAGHPAQARRPDRRRRGQDVTSGRGAPARTVPDWW